MITFTTAAELETALKHAEEEHAKYEATLGHRDVDWARWYSLAMWHAAHNRDKHADGHRLYSHYKEMAEANGDQVEPWENLNRQESDTWADFAELLWDGWQHRGAS